MRKARFTGASDKHLGKFQEADGGTLFLDEIGELRLDMQVKLLRALQEGEVDPVGSKRPVKVDVRIISATNRDLGQLAQGRQFREDLYYRLNVFPVMVPPLRERTGDVAPLARHLHRAFRGRGEQAGRRPDAGGQPADRTFRLAGQCAPAREHHLPRRGVVRRHDAGCLRLPADRRRDGRRMCSARTVRRPPPALRLCAPVRCRADSPFALCHDAAGHMRKLEDIESEIIRMAISRYDGHMSEVARRLGIGRSTLYRKLKDFGLEPGNAPKTCRRRPAIEEAIRKAG